MNSQASHQNVGHHPSRHSSRNSQSLGEEFIILGTPGFSGTHNQSAYMDGFLGVSSFYGVDETRCGVKSGGEWLGCLPADGNVGNHNVFPLMQRRSGLSRRPMASRIRGLAVLSTQIRLQHVPVFPAVDRAYGLG